MIKKKQISNYFSTLGKKGGTASAQSKTPLQRKRQAQKAAKARWNK